MAVAEISPDKIDEVKAVTFEECNVEEAIVLTEQAVERLGGNDKEQET